jgi:hypothetical protein
MGKPPKIQKIKFSKLMGEEGEDLDKFLVPALQHIKEKIKKNEGLEAFIMSWGLVEQIVIPTFIKIIAKKVDLRQLPDLDRLTAHQLITCYYFLSHDEESYEKLCIANSERNTLVHKIYKKNSDLKLINKEAIRVANYIRTNVLRVLILKLFGDPPVPVLTLYGKGWNDAINKCLEAIDGKLA